VRPSGWPVLVCAPCLRLGANGEPADAADLWRQFALRRPAGELTGLGSTVAAMIGNSAALEVFRLLTG